MRVLCITFEAPSRKYGGGWGIEQSLISMCANAKVDYIGPFFERKDFKRININKCFFVEETKCIFSKAINLMLGHPVRYYKGWKKAISQIHPKQYDFVFVDFSYNDFVVSWAHRNSLKAIVRVHNIERDMTANIIGSKAINKYFIRSILNGCQVRLRERKAMRSADALLFLTEKDYCRAAYLYGEEVRQKSEIIPVCLEEHQPQGKAIKSHAGTEYILATGSLYFGPNSNGIKWFIRNVWQEIQKKSCSAMSA